MNKTEFRKLPKLYSLMEKYAADTKKRLDDCHPGSAPNDATICKWFAKLLMGHVITEDNESSGRSKEAWQKYQKIRKVILDERSRSR